jgi:hypothetical protein
MMVMNPPANIRPPPGYAMVVFIRPSAYAYAIGATILDENGRFVGDAAPEAHFAAAVTPGHHIFLAWAENTAAIQVDAVPGKTYYVEVQPRMGAWSARMQLTAIKPSSPSWARKDAWLHDTKQLKPDLPRGQAEMDRRSGDRAERIRRAHQIMTEYKPDELAERTLGPDDGV